MAGSGGAAKVAWWSGPGRAGQVERAGSRDTAEVALETVGTPSGPSQGAR
jgi:hypothetical protein